MEDVNICIDKLEPNLTLQHCKHNDEPKEHFLWKLSEFSCEKLTFDFAVITVLDISHTYILKQLPGSVRKLNLKKLILAYNKFKEVPCCLYTGLENLEFLDLSHNLITTFDIEPACAKKIISLKLNDNHLYNFPQWILTAHCVSLRELDYSRNFMIQLNPGQTMFIEKLEMRNDQLIDDDFKFFKRIKTLELLDIGNDGSLFNENRFKEMNNLFKKSGWKNLKVLNLNNISLSIVPKDIFQMTTLTELYLVNCDLNWICEDVVYLVKLEILDVSQNAICALPSFLTSLPKLRIIKAQKNNISSVCDFFATPDVLDLYDNYLEAAPRNIEKIEYIDLEYNLFDTSTIECYQNYTTKRAKLRERFSYERGMGAREMREEPYPFDDNDLSSEDSGEGSLTYNYEIEIEDECWDDEYAPAVPRIRNPDVTPSDDEWDGKFEITIKKKKPDFSLWYDVDEDWIFCDAEQD